MSQTLRIMASLPVGGVHQFGATVDMSNINPQFTNVELANFEYLDSDSRTGYSTSYFRLNYIVEFLQPSKLKNGPYLSQLTGIPSNIEYLDIEYSGHSKVQVIAVVPPLRLKMNEEIEVEPIIINLEYSDGATRNFDILINGRKFDLKQVLSAIRADKNELEPIDLKFGDYDFQHQIGLIMTCAKR